MPQKPNNQKPNPRPDPNKKESTSRHVYVEPGVKIDFVQDLRDKHDIEQGQQSAYQNQQLLWTIVAAVLLLVTAALAGWQGYLIHTQFRKDQRAWLKVSPVSKGAITLTEGRPIPIDIRFLNMGKTPAKQIKAHVFVEVIKNGLSPAFDEWLKKPLPHDFMTTGIIFPTEHSDMEAKRTRFQSGSTTIMEDFPLLPSENKDAIEGKSYIAIYGEARYQDVFGIDHWTRFCTWMYLGTGVYTSYECVARNDVDTN